MKRTQMYNKQSVCTLSQMRVCKFNLQNQGFKNQPKSSMGWNRKTENDLDQLTSYLRVC